MPRYTPPEALEHRASWDRPKLPTFPWRLPPASSARRRQDPFSAHGQIWPCVCPFGRRARRRPVSPDRSATLRKPLVSDHAAAFDTAWVDQPGVFNQLSTDRTFTIAPPPLLARMGAKAFEISKGPTKLVFSSRSAVSVLPTASSEERTAIPALFIRRVTSPQSAAASAMSLALVTSSLTGTTPGSLSDDGSRA
jgi:hypothetical protein